MRGVAHLFDFRLPKNFDRPIASTDFLDLWSRWHMTLSEWFKLYLFNPLTKAMIAAVDRPRWVPLLGAGGYLATFFMMGLWQAPPPGSRFMGSVSEPEPASTSCFKR